jgi:phosphoesterase RecJ-like protein
VFARIKETIEKGGTFLVTTHADPDGDAVGSAFAVCLALADMGKEAAVYLKDPVPYMYAFLPRPRSVIHRLPENGYDVVFVVDCGKLDRVGEASAALAEKGFIVNIDHHEANEAFGRINIVDERASSTAEILYLMFKFLDVKLTYEIAVNLYTAVLTDTGSFHYESTTRRAFSICEEMTCLGVRPASVAAAVYESQPKERYHLLCIVLATLETIREDRVATAYVTREMFEKTGTNREHAEGFVEILKEIRGVDVACFMRELSDGRYKISMRSKGEVNVASVARAFGGGGHRNAAGCVIEGGIDTVKTRLAGAISL